jgi:hypothetical protein
MAPGVGDKRTINTVKPAHRISQDGCHRHFTLVEWPNGFSFLMGNSFGQLKTNFLSNLCLMYLCYMQKPRFFPCCNATIIGLGGKVYCLYTLKI